MESGVQGEDLKRYFRVLLETKILSFRNAEIYPALKGVSNINTRNAPNGQKVQLFCRTILRPRLGPRTSHIRGPPTLWAIYTYNLCTRKVVMNPNTNMMSK